MKFLNSPANFLGKSTLRDCDFMTGFHNESLVKGRLQRSPETAGENSVFSSSFTGEITTSCFNSNGLWLCGLKARGQRQMNHLRTTGAAAALCWETFHSSYQRRTPQPSRSTGFIKRTISRSRRCLSVKGRRG